MTEHEQLLKKFRDDRGLHEYNHEAFIEMVNQELQEVLDAGNWNHRIEEMCDVCVLCFNALEQQGWSCDDVVFAEAVPQGLTLIDYVEDTKHHIKLGFVATPLALMRDCITLNGYDFDKAMTETAKKINSREGAMNPKTLKWEKSKTQDKSTLYIPNYDKCKL